MEEEAFTKLLSYSERVIREKAVPTLRPASAELFEKTLDSKLVIAIKGLRGVGKSSLLLEMIKQSEKGMYLNGEFLLKSGYGLYEVLNYAYSQGITVFGIDEIQVLTNWPADLKLFYDESKVKIRVTGSSAIGLALQSSELARRAQLEELRPFSFREYIYLKTSALLKKRTIEELIEDRFVCSKEIAPFINLYPEFMQKYGLPAAFFEGPATYNGIIERIVYHDLLPLKSIDITYIDSTFKLLKFLASSKPGEVSYNSIANSMGRSVKFAIELIRLLSLSGILSIVSPYGSGHKAIRGECKVLLPLSFRTALGEYFGVKIESGALREDFFIHHVPEAKYFKEAGKKIPDYVVGKNIFEIGGECKGHAQLKGLKNTYVVKESLSVGKNEIPLYVFGLLY